MSYERFNMFLRTKHSPFPTRTSADYSDIEAVRLSSSRKVVPDCSCGNIRYRTRPVSTLRACLRCKQLDCT